MNNNHLQETARHYAQLAEQARVDLQEANELNGELLGIIEALCEHFGLDTQSVLEDIQTDERRAESAKAIADAKQRAKNTVSTQKERDVGREEGRAETEEESPLTYGIGGKVLKPASEHGKK